MGGERGPGQLVTGEDAQKSIAAALTAVPAPRTTCTRRPTGTYRVMVTTAEGKHIVVTLDANFAVTGQQEMRGAADPATAEAPQPPSRRRSRPPTLLWRGFRAQPYSTSSRPVTVISRSWCARTTEPNVVLLDENYAVQSVENPARTAENAVWPPRTFGQGRDRTEVQEGRSIGAGRGPRRHCRWMCARTARSTSPSCAQMTAGGHRHDELRLQGHRDAGHELSSRWSRSGRSGVLGHRGLSRP